MPDRKIIKYYKLLSPGSSILRFHFSERFPMSSPLVPLDSFDSFGISPLVMDSMKDMGYTAPTPIQQQALPILLKGADDFIGLASTGTGKTAAFGIPLVENIEASTKDTQALVLSPTRELALQVAEQLTLLGKKKGLRVVTIYGGASYRSQLEGIRRGAHIVVATPGRLVDFLEQKYIKLQNVKTVVLDEADEMLSMGFKDDLDMILKATHSDGSTSARAACRTWLFSATMSTEVRRLATTYLEKPQMVQADKSNETQKLVEQFYYTVMNKNKKEAICRILQTLPEFYGIIFCQTKMEVADLADMLASRGFPTDSLHGDKNQQEREATLRKFKQRHVKIIVATDVAARGLDIKDLTHVVNHSLPWDAESYVHRIGRTGRNGQKGIALTLVDTDQLHLLRRISQSTKSTMTKGVIPSADEVAGLKTKEVLEKVTGTQADAFETQLARDFIVDLVQSGEMNLTDLTKEDLLAKLVVAFFPNLFVKKDIPLDYMGDRVPREMLPREAGDNRFTENRGGGGGGGYRGRTGGGGRGGFGGRRFDSDRSADNNSRGASATAGSNRARPAAAATGERSFNSDAGDRDRSSDRGASASRSERPAGYRGAVSSSAPPRRSEVPGVKRHRSSDNNSQGAKASKRS
jgi:ATP-dependent RNA helicase DeaD